MALPVTLPELSRRVRAQSSAPLLGMAISDVERSIGEPEVGRIIGYVARKLGLESFGEFLESHESQRVLEGALSERDRAWVLSSIESFVSRTSHKARRHIVERRELGLDDVGRTPAEVERFCEGRGMAAFLHEPLRALVPYLHAHGFRGISELSPGSRLVDLMHGRGLPERMGRRSAAGREIFEAVREAVRDELGRRDDQSALDAALAVRPEGAALRRFSARLAEARRAMRSSENGSAPLLESLHAVEVVDEGPAVVGEFHFPRARGARNPVATRLVLAGYEDGAIQSSCDCDGIDAAPADACAHRISLFGHVLRVVHDPAHPLFSSLAEMLETPTWARFIDAANAALKVELGGEKAREERIVFRLDRTSTRPAIHVVLQKKLKSGRWSAGSILPIERAHERDDLLSPRDLPIVDALLGARTQRKTRGDVVSAHAREAVALRGLVGHRRVIDADDPERFVLVEAMPLTVALVPTDGLARLEFRLGDHAIDPREVEEGMPILRHDDDRPRSLVGELDPRVEALLDAARRFPALLPEEAQHKLLEWLPTLQPRVRIEVPRRMRGRRVAVETRLIARLDPLDAGGLRIELGVRPFGHGVLNLAGHGPETVFGFLGDERVHAERDLRAERGAAERLRAELQLHEADAEGPSAHRIPDLEESLLLLERLAEQAVPVEWPEGSSRLSLHRSLGADDLRVRVSSLGRLLAIEGEASTGDGESKIPLSALLDAVKRGKRYVRLSDGGFSRIEDDLRRLLERARGVAYEDQVGLIAGIASAAALESLAGAVKSLDGDDAYRALLSRLHDAEAREPLIPQEFRGELRAYQREGFRWLSNLATWAGGAVLADEMGLGKTVQTLALLVERSDDGPSLVVAPTSVLSNWAEEARRFAPSLDVVVLHGRDRRKLLSLAAPKKLFVTSYDLLVRDVDALSEVRFAGFILDEAQSVKNPRTQRAKAAARIDAAFRVALTGTPLENHLGELFSIVELVTPGLLGNARHFRDHYALPIEKAGNEARRDALLEVLRPFLLRRTKQTVAPELPPKIEVVHPVELTDAERLLYETARREILDGYARSEAPEAERRFVVLASLTRLRRLVCNPRLVDPESRVTSGKLTAFTELITELMREGHRALVFSQFTSHLKLVRERLDALGIPCLYLDGATPQASREELVKGFQEGQAPVFLISLKAGGTGLNLTAADYVIHLDPWWNPAAEDQASDRAHRLGRVEPVTVVRLVAQGTIEEAVLELHERKRELAQGILEGADAIGAVSSDDLLALVRHGAVPPRAPDGGVGDETALGDLTRP
jgi:superfamily II DNA or RNA helicase